MSADPMLSVSTLLDRLSANVSRGMLALHHVWNAKHLARILPVAHMPTASQMALRRIASAKKDGPSTPVILQQDALTSMSAILFTDLPESVATMPFARMSPEDTRASVPLVSPETPSDCASTWTSAVNKTRAVKVPSVITWQVPLSALVPREQSLIPIRVSVALLWSPVSQTQSALETPFVMSTSGVSVPSQISAMTAATRARP